MNIKAMNGVVLAAFSLWLSATLPKVVGQTLYGLPRPSAHIADMRATALSQNASVVIEALLPEHRPGIVNAYSVSTGKRIFTVHEPRVYAQDLSSDGKLLAVTSDYQHIHIWNVVTGKLKKTIPGSPNSSFTLKYIPNTHLLLMAENSKVVIWDTQTGAKVRELQSDGIGEILKLSLSYNGTYLALLDDKQTVFVWNLKKSRIIKKMPSMPLTDPTISVSPNGEHLAVGDSNGLLHIYAIPSGSLETEFKSHAKGVSAVAYSPDGALIASGGKDGSAKLWNSHTGKILKATPETTAKIDAVIFTSSGNTLFVFHGGVMDLSVPRLR